MEGPYAQIRGKDLEFLMKKKKVVIGRDSKLGDVDLNLGSTRFISRRHLEIIWDSDFFFMCRGKNGVFVNDIFQRRENKRLPLPPLCEIRFPSTAIKVEFTSLVSGNAPPIHPIHSPVTLPPKLDPQFCSPFVSPAPSPTGTISAVNSCPVSPNSEFRNRVPNFDLKVMATYASKLLSTQQYRQHPHHQQQHQTEERITAEDDSQLSDENQEDNDVAEVVEASSAQGNPCHLNSNDGKEAPPTGMGTVDEEDEEVEGVESSQGGVASDAGGGGGSGGEEKSQQKPPYSYAQLIVQALLAAKDHRQTLSSIYSFISDMYPYYKMSDKGWKNSIRHNLSLNQYFAKAPREKEGLGFGKGGYWCMHPDYEDKLTSQAYVKRKKKGIPVFPSSHLISSRSAPPSPTHHPSNDLPLSSLKEINNSAAGTAATVETPRLTLPLPPSTSHFTLNTYFPNLPQAVNSSHSLPASPSRPPTFPPGAAKFFPVPTKKERDEEGGGSKEAPVMKKPRMDDDGSGIVKPRPIPLGAPGQTIPTTSLGSLGNIVSLPPHATMQQHPSMPGAPPPGLFIPISLTAAAAGLANPQRPGLPPPQGMPLAPHPFLSGYFNCGATQAVPLPVPVTAANSAPTNSSSE